MPEDLVANARFFKPRNYEDSLIDRVVDDLIELLEASGNKKQKQMLRYLVLDMRLRHIELPDGWLICSRDRNSNTNFYNVTEPYASLGVTYNPLVSIMDKMLHSNPSLIELIRGIHYDNASFITRIRPTEALLQRISVIPEVMVRDPRLVPQEIVLKEKIITFPNGKRKVKRRRIGFEVNDDINYLQNRVRFFNDCLRQCKLDLLNPADFSAQSEVPTGVKETQININLNNKYLFRSYVNNFERGGRFYGGWWQGVPSSMRSYILIDDEPTVEVDFKGHHIALLYSLAGINFFDGDETRDPYKVEGWPREDVKLLLQIVLNSPRDYVAKAYNNERRKDGKPLIPESRLEILVNLFEEMHNPIKSYFYGDWGVNLQNFDAKIVAYVMACCMMSGVNDFSGSGLDNKFVVLPIHDSFIVKHKHLNQLLFSMREAVVDAIMEVEYSGIGLMAQYQPVMKIGETINSAAFPQDYAYLERSNLHRDGITIPELRILKRISGSDVDTFCIT